jgi:predicted nucleic acid-binding protein
MTRGYPKPIVLDTTVLSNFASTDEISLLTTVLESPVGEFLRQREIDYQENNPNKSRRKECLKIAQLE